MPNRAKSISVLVDLSVLRNAVMAQPATRGPHPRPRYPGDIILEWWATSAGIRNRLFEVLSWVPNPNSRIVLGGRLDDKRLI